MADEKIFTIPLRKKFIVYPEWRRTKVAVKTVRSFLKKHLKTNNVLVGKYLNSKLHEGGRKHPPHHVQVKVWKEKDMYHAELIDAPVEKQEKEAKKKEVPKEEKKETPKVEVPQVQKEETKEEQEKEKKEALKHPDEKKVKKEPAEVKRKVKGAQKKGEREHKKEVFSRTQKPKHEKKKQR